MIYAKIEGGVITKYPYDKSDLKKSFPNVSFPSGPILQQSILDDYDIVEVHEVEMPYKPGFRAIQDDPKWVDNSWIQSWRLEPKDVGELSRDEITLVDPPVEDGYKVVEGTPELDGDIWKQTWVLVELPYDEKRMLAYGLPETQLEFITENGIEAWQTKVAEIKSKYPKP